MSSEHTEIVRIGAGSFATVFVWQSHNNVVLKRVADPTRCAELRREYENLHLLQQTPFNLTVIPDCLDNSKAVFPAGDQENRQAFVSRIYLGKQCRESRFFNPLNFPLDATRLALLNLGIESNRT
jgi:hypothetical protein